MKLLPLAAALLLLTASASAFAGEYLELYRGARAAAMGNAFTGLADDEQAIFFNPAGLAGIRKFNVRYMAADVELSTDILTTVQESQSAFQNLSGDTLNALMGKNIFARAQIVPTIVMPNIGVALLVDQQMAILAKNQAYPQITLGYQTTNGIQVAYGQSLSRKGRRGGEGVDDFRIGVAGKLLWRRGGYKVLDINDIMTVSQDTLYKVAGTFERGYGFDFGIQYLRNLNSRLTLSFGSAWTDIGDTKFNLNSDPIKSNLSTGIAAKYQLPPRMNLIVSYDYRHILDGGDWKKKSHLGVEFSLPLLSVYAGLNQAFFTYGVGFDLWLFKITAASYAEEMGSYATQDPQRRLLLQAVLKLGL